MEEVMGLEEGYVYCVCEICADLGDTFNSKIG